MRQASLDIDEVYRLHARVVLRRARQILGTEADALDALHEIFLGLMNNPDQFRGESSIVTWLYAVTTNHCLNRLRNQKNRRRLLNEVVAPTAGATVCSADNLTELHQLLCQLPLEEVQVAVYYYLDGMTQEEIADLLGCSRRHVYKLLTSLREKVEKESDVARVPA